ncbi:hypothetical protein DY000_02024372 [Brassica cretica]|uniref:Reverse transcriptase zinc-binding domain-containing protein n=1 Tax=Brassica cretica TaxID=69181 RepID=A0ABQ7EC64_BRACR|nr:hypothetical protein DY000_02024372 [Brassica cretica]
MNREYPSYVLNLRPTLFDNQDILIWCFTKTGEYTGKSRYNLQKQLSNQTLQHNDGNSSITDGMNQLCLTIWKLNLPPKVKVVWWKLVHQGMAAAENLQEKRSKIDSTCQVCGEEHETQNDLMFTFRVLKETWSLVPPECKALDLNQETIL